MRPLIVYLASVLLAAQIAVISCDDDHHYHHSGDRLDVAVTISGDGGTRFDAFFEDDRRSQSLSGAVPFSAAFPEQEGHFQAIVDKISSGPEQICVRIETYQDSKQSCTSAAYGTVSVTLYF